MRHTIHFLISIIFICTGCRNNFLPPDNYCEEILISKTPISVFRGHLKNVLELENFYDIPKENNVSYWYQLILDRNFKIEDVVVIEYVDRGFNKKLINKIQEFDFNLELIDEKKAELCEGFTFYVSINIALDEIGYATNKKDYQHGAVPQ